VHRPFSLLYLAKCRGHHHLQCFRRGFGECSLLDHHFAANGTSITFLHFIADTNLQQQTAGYQHLAAAPPLSHSCLFDRPAPHVSVSESESASVSLSWFSPHMTSIFAQWLKICRLSICKCVS